MAGFKGLKLGSDTKMFDDLASCSCLTYKIKKNLGPEVFEDVLRGWGWGVVLEVPLALDIQDQ